MTTRDVAESGIPDGLRGCPRQFILENGDYSIVDDSAIQLFCATCHEDIELWLEPDKDRPAQRSEVTCCGRTYRLLWHVEVKDEADGW